MRVFNHRSHYDDFTEGISVECSNFNRKLGVYPQSRDILIPGFTVNNKRLITPRQNPRKIITAVRCASSPFDAMGRAHSKSEEESDVDADVPDALGLTARNKAVIKSSLKLLQPNLTEHGHRFFCRSVFCLSLFYLQKGCAAWNRTLILIADFCIF